MFKFSIHTAFNQFVLVVLSVFALAITPGKLVSQTPEIAPEQNIFVAPLTNMEAPPLPTIDATIISICDLSSDQTNYLSEACQKMLAQVVSSYGDSVASHNAAVVRLQSQAAEFTIENQKHITSTLEAQRIHSGYLFWLAVSVVLLGVVASAFQFLKVWKQDVVAQAEITISQKELSIKTSWIGVVLLGISMAFFGLYLWFVYQITPL